MIGFHIYDCFPEFLEWKMFQVKVVERVKTYFIFSNFFPKILPFMRNVVEPERPHYNIILRMRFACWVSKPINE